MVNKNNVVITVYEEAPRRRKSSGGRPQSGPHRLRVHARGYDRRKMLLAYTHQLRQFNAEGKDMQVVPPEWKRWKATYEDNNYKRRKGLGSKIRVWIRRVFRRRQSKDGDGIMEMRSCSSSNHSRLRRILCAWMRRGGMMGCYEKLNS